MKFIYTRIKDEIRIDKIEDPEAVIYVPEQFEDCPVTELGSYVLAHSAVEEIHLPPYVRKIGAYGFYECEQLKRIYCYSRVLDLGAGLFGRGSGCGVSGYYRVPGGALLLKGDAGRASSDPAGAASPDAGCSIRSSRGASDLPGILRGFCGEYTGPHCFY